MYFIILIVDSLVNQHGFPYSHTAKDEEARKSFWISGFLPYIAASTALFSGMLGIPPLCSVDRLAAVEAKAPI